MTSIPVASIDELNVGVDICITSAALSNNGVGDERYFRLALFERLVGRNEHASVARGRGEAG